MLHTSKFLTDDELKRLLALLDRLKGKDRRWATLVKLAFFTGARASELLAIRLPNDLKDGTLTIKGLKGSLDREIPLKRDLNAELLSLGEVPFPFSYARLYALWQDFSPNGKKFHSLRHTRAIQLYKKTKDIKLVQLVLGHKAISSTMRYVDFCYSQEQMKKLL